MNCATPHRNPTRKSQQLKGIDCQLEGYDLAADTYGKSILAGWSRRSLKRMKSHITTLEKCVFNKCNFYSQPWNMAGLQHEWRKKKKPNNATRINVKRYLRPRYLLLGQISDQRYRGAGSDATTGVNTPATRSINQLVPPEWSPHPKATSFPRKKKSKS